VSPFEEAKDGLLLAEIALERRAVMAERVAEVLE